MRCLRFFLFLFLTTSLVYGLNQKECTDIHNQVISEWNQHNQLIEQFEKVGHNEEGVRLLQESIECLRRAVSYCDIILNNIAGKSKKKQQEPWRVSMKEVCEQDKNNLNIEICELEKGVDHILSSIAFEKAKTLYEESTEKARLAETKIETCNRSLSNIDATVSTLNESAELYEEAAALASEALTILVSAPSYSDESKVTLTRAKEDYQEASNRYKTEASNWPETVLAEITTLKGQFAILKEDIRLFEEKGLKRSSYELQKQAVIILENLIECSPDDEKAALEEEFIELKNSIALFETEIDRGRLTETQTILSSEEFKTREKERRDVFFEEGSPSSSQIFLQALLQNETSPLVIPLDGPPGKKNRDFTLYTEQFYRFLVQSHVPFSHLIIRVSKQGELLHEEKIAFPLKNTISWQRYLSADGMVFIPETKLKADFGIELRLKFVYDPMYPFSMIIAQKGNQSGYQLSFSLDGEEPIYQCALSPPPPWQLDALRKPSLPIGDRPIEKTSYFVDLHDHKGSENQVAPYDSINYPILDELVDELQKNPLLLASYVYNEIDLVDPFLKQENGVFQAPGIHRNPYMTFLEKRGSPWEQCQLLVYLLQKAGYQASYVIGKDPLTLPKAFAEKMLSTKLPEKQEEALLQYPWVIFSNGKELVSLFPWMKEMQIAEGYDVYNFMPDEYASADRWILRYLKGDENILKHIDPNGDDTAALLFSRFVEEELRKQGLSFTDVGIQRTPCKRQFSSWRDFPRPKIEGNYQVFDYLSNIPNIFAFAIIEIFSHENPEKKISHTVPLAYFACSSIPIRFVPKGDQKDRLLVQLIGEFQERFLDFDSTDHLIDIKVSYSVPIGSDGFNATKTLSLGKGTSAALCFHFGGRTPHKTSQFYKQFSSEKDEGKRLHALLAFVSASYFEKCGYGEEILANLHKVNPMTVFVFGLAKLCPDQSKNPFEDTQNTCMPQVDMFWFHSQPQSHSDLTIRNEEINSARMQCEALVIVDSSSNEHQILREVFKDPYAISTVKLLQLSHLEQQKKGLEGEGFLLFTPESFELAEKMPEVAQSLYFSHLKDLNLRDVIAASPSQWNGIKSFLDPEQPYRDWSYAYLTPGLILSQDSTYKEMGALILSPCEYYALISNNNLFFHGGLGSPLPNSYFTPDAISNWELARINSPFTNSYSLEIPYLTSPPFIPFPSYPAEPIPEITRWSVDVRPEHRTWINTVADPVDTVSGAFYVDEVDLMLPGPFFLEIRRNYNSQNPLIGDFGCGWKLGLFPFLIEQDDKLYAAEPDGTVICYSYNPSTSKWEVIPEDNPDLYNFNRNGTGGIANPFHNYIENNILYGSDGSKRVFKDGQLEKWLDPQGNALTFTYKNERLSRIESSNGDFCGFHYNHEGKISEIYAKDGRRISYNYNSQGDLVQVILPNTASISYEYDRHHRIIRETKPHGKVLENIYDEEGRVKEQRSPMGPAQKMITTATFEYADGVTTVTDAGGGKTIYKIFEKQIYKVIDPLGYSTLQSWFIDEKSWFDPKTEQITAWNQNGGAIKSLKTTTDKRGLTTTYLYDSQGNPEEIGLEGNDLTGSGETAVTKKLTYNKRNLCVEEEVCGQKTVITYDSIFLYQPKRIEKYSGKTLISYVDLTYNSFGQVEKKDCNGAVTCWKYDTRGFPYQKTQITGTDDPDVVTTFTYSNQGQCIKLRSADRIQESDYDIMGNLIQSHVFSLSGKLLSATYRGYDLNNEPIWKQTANPDNTLYLDYHASGRIKASRHQLTPSEKVAYTLYEYDSRGYLIEEVDPLGYCTYREYDALGNVLCQTKEGHSTHFTYESGGLVETIISPSGAKRKSFYTTNGLLKEEIYPDKTKTSIIYDFFGRPIQEEKNEIKWKITYDDPEHRIIRTHVETGASEVQAFDANGNMVCFIDSAGYAWEKTYDGLGRIKTETSPSGEQTVWKYHGDQIICTLPNGEKKLERYEGGQLVESKVTDLHGNLISHSTFRYDPETDIETLTQGEEITTTWMNAVGLPFKVQKGEIITNYEYDVCGNCVAIIDGEGEITRHEFDGLSRMIRKELPDGGLLRFSYDLDSNLIESHLPNGNIWKACYDKMGRKCSEKLQAGWSASQQWQYSYENGFLKTTTDLMGRIRNYAYDSHGRLIQETVDGWERIYTYDSRGLLSSAEQTQSPSWLTSWFYTPRQEHSKIERAYDADGHLTIESIYLNSKLIQETHQTWSPSSRTLQIEDHKRTLTYQNNRLSQVVTESLDLDYTYHPSGALKDKLTPLSQSTTSYNPSGLPEHIGMRTPDGSYQESLAWNHCGKLSAYASSSEEKQFTYTSRGYLQSAGTEKYEFDFGKAGIGVRTSASNLQVSEYGLDPFGKTIEEISNNHAHATTYNLMGQTTSHGERQFEWDPWGRLLKVSDGAFTWEASYDALGRRLQTRYTPDESPTLVTTSFYDPEIEFQEIGVKYGDKTFWKIYGPNNCEAVIDEEGSVVFLLHNALNELIGTITEQGTHYLPKTCSAYGPQAVPSIPSDLLSYAHSLNWHSTAQDPTGLIWMGERYYNPRTGRFMSPDSVGYPICLDLYAYANGDPVNFADPNGRFASSIYHTIKPLIIESIYPINSFNQIVQVVNRLPANMAENQLGNSMTFQLGHSNLPYGSIGYINGIMTTLGQSIDSVYQLSLYAQGAMVEGIYNATNGFLYDILECGVGHAGFHTPPVQLLKNQWAFFIATHGSDKKFLQICHSGGADHVYNALVGCPESVRERIIVLAIAPSVIIPEELCFKSYNYVSRRDFVTHLDVCGKMIHGNELHILEPHPDADFHDHAFLSPTFERPLKDHISDHIKN